MASITTSDHEKMPTESTPQTTPSQDCLEKVTVKAESDTDVEAQSSSKVESSDANEDKKLEGTKPTDAPFTVLGDREKLVFLFTVSFMGIISPLSSAVYYPAIGDMARALGVSVSQINVSISTYMIFQGIAPSFVGSISDNHGRRPAYMYCYVVYLAANIGLALQNNYAALLVLRMLQSAGSSATIALGSAVAADICTRAERGKYMGYAQMGVTLGPALGPVIGGLLTQYLGWRAIFWFLAILSGVLLLFTIFLMPETSRAVVGNGSIPPQRWNRSITTIVKQRQHRKKGIVDVVTSEPDKPKKRPKPWTSVLLFLERETALLLVFGGLLNAGYFICLSTLTSQLASNYGYDPVIIGVCYLPIGLGSIASRWVAGTCLDRNFKRHAKLSGMTVDSKRQQDVNLLDIEKARLQVVMPLVYGACATVIAYGWVMKYRTSIAGPEVVLFFAGLFLSGSGTCINLLVVDIHKDSPASVSAASNLSRCLFSAAATGFAQPLIDAIGIGWTTTAVAFVWLAFSPLLWLVYFRGFRWRKEDLEKVDAVPKKANGLAWWRHFEGCFPRRKAQVDQTQ